MLTPHPLTHCRESGMTDSDHCALAACHSEIMLGLVTAIEPRTRQSVARSEWAVWPVPFGLLIRMSNRQGTRRL